MKKNIILIILASVAIFSSCDDLFSPLPEDFKTENQMITDRAYAQGFLMNAYRYIPSYYDNSEYATDDAVTNQKTNGFLKVATGSWTSSNNPFNLWTTGYGAIQYLNIFLSYVDSVKWSETNPSVKKLFATRMKGEAYGMRALMYYYLLRNHGGVTADGKLMGVPIITEKMVTTSDFNIPRATFSDCVKQIYKDLDSAVNLLPDEYIDITSNSQIPVRYQAIVNKFEIYNSVMGGYARQLFNGLIAKSIRSKTALLAASPAFQDASNTVTWADAADYSAVIIDYKGGVAGLPANGLTYYFNSAEITALKDGNNPPEMIWRQNIITTSSSDQESQNFPPSLFGKGYMNPTQNLVDAFPMLNGYPINNPASGYNAANPYANRDPRLAMYIIYNGSTAGVSSTVIKTGSSSGTDDGINVKETSTRTGYYMKKRLRMDVNCNPSSITEKTHYTPRIRYTELYLNYAEAANEAWGPTGVGIHTYSAYDVIKAIRKRAGIGLTNGDPYLEECKLDKDKMRALIRNERRLELSFESFRFWDLRRWKVDLNEAARGMDVNGTVYTPLTVEARSFDDYMYYGPIPYTEILKYGNLIQNKGWK